MATTRPVVSVHPHDMPSQAANYINLPPVFSAPLRADLVRWVHLNMAKNKRQAQGVKYEAGYDTAAASWGTGRAVARIPRVPGGGTHRSGQGAFGNMCRGGGMFNPTKTWRRWHRKTNVTQKRHALAVAISATAQPALVMARGHQIDEVPEMPLVVSDGAESISKTKDALALLKGLGCGAELEKSKGSKKIRAGRGKCRNRRYVMRKGPLVVYHKDQGIARAFRALPGVELACVERLNLLQLAPGGAFGRLCVYTEGAVQRLSGLFGNYKGGSQEKKKYTLPRAIMTNTDLARIINSDEIQSVLKPRLETARVTRQRKNPLKNRSVLGRLCPAALGQRKVRKSHHVKGSAEQKAQVKRTAAQALLKKKHRPAKKEFYKKLQNAHAVQEAKRPNMSGEKTHFHVEKAAAPEETEE